MSKWVFLVVCACICFGVQGGVAPFLTPCKASDETCMKASAERAIPVLAAGIPELGIEPMDPMHFTRIKATQAGLNMDFKNTNVKGLRNCHVVGLKRRGNKIHFDIKCSVTLIGDYTLGGKLLIMDVSGSGKYKIKIRDIVVSLVMDIGEFTDKNVKHWQIKSWKHTYDVKTGASFTFQNLFNGNKQLSDAVHNFANSSWKDISQEVAPPIVEAIVARLVAETKKFFAAVPMNELTLE